MSGTENNGNNGEPIKVLVVEDDATDAYLLKRFLQKSDYDTFDVKVSLTLDDALTLIKNSSFDAVVLDINLSGKANLKGLQRCRQANASLPIIVVTGFYEESMARKAIRLGAQDFLSKTEITTQILSRVIDHSISRKAVENELARHAFYDQDIGLE